MQRLLLTWFAIFLAAVLFAISWKLGELIWFYIWVFMGWLI